VSSRIENETLVSTKRGIDWLEQFSLTDKADAYKLLEAVRWVSEAEFSKSMREAVAAYSSSVNGPIAIVVERELRRPGGKIQRFYWQPSSGPKRATGVGLQPVEAIRSTRRDVGSEGVLASIASRIKRDNPSKFYVSPTAEEVREKRIRSFLILTDTVGSGKRVTDILESLWSVSSIKSWASGHFINFAVIAFSATESGESLVRHHSSKPELYYTIPCPTIRSLFKGEEVDRLYQLCSKYDPISAKDDWSFLGFWGQGTLIAYAHGMPNNAPNILHKGSSRWKPLFPYRSSSNLVDEMTTSDFIPDAEAALKKMRQNRIAASSWLREMDTDARSLLSVLASLSRPPRTVSAISRRTGVNVREVAQKIDLALHYGWIDRSFHLTDDGNMELEYFRKNSSPQPKTDGVFKLPEKNYYPTSLRVPD